MKPIVLGERCRWTILGALQKRKILCRCECGTERFVSTSNLRCGRSLSCGCLIGDLAKQRKTHGKSGTRTFRIWSGLFTRCCNTKHHSYQDYGGRGIGICKEWSDFQTFLSDMGECPSQKHSLDRIDNDGHYEKENCRWATSKVQTRNQRRIKSYTIKGKTKRLIEWAEEYKIAPSIVRYRLKSNWPIEKALTTPVQNSNFKGSVIEIGGRKKTLGDWAKHMDMRYDCIYRRITKKKWSAEKAILTPPRRRLKKKKMVTNP